MEICRRGLDSIPVKDGTDGTDHANLSNSYYIPVCCLLLYMHCSHNAVDTQSVSQYTLPKKQSPGCDFFF